MKNQPFRKTYILLVTMLAIVLLAMIGGSTQAADDKWTANFWNNKNLEGTPVLTRWDQTINFDWGHGSPDPAVNDDNFSASWVRNVYFDAGTYRFNATMDDAMRVKIDGNTIIDSWTDSQEHTMSRDYSLTQGDHKIVVEYYESGGVAIAKFNWQLVGDGGSGGGAYYPNWKGEYFNNTTLSGAPVMVRDDRYLSFNWGYGSPAPGVINPDFFSVRWTKTIDTNPGNYRIFITSDDGSRLYVNNVLLIDNWGVQASTTKWADYYYPGGPVELRVEYFEQIERANINTGVGLVPPGG
jgi:hypothetical protein